MRALLSFITVSAVLVAASACAPKTPPTASGVARTEATPMPTEPRHPADATLARLAEAFAAKNIPGVVADVSDAWSGTRFLPDWGAASWAGAAAELRSATLVSDSDGVRTYTIVRRGSSRQIEVRNHNGRWVLDYNSFRGPFPH